MAASADYFLKIDGVEGEAKAKVTVRGWDPEKKEAVAPNIGSSGQDGVAARDSSPKVTASQNTQSLRESPTRSGDVKLTASQNSQSLRESPTRASTGGVSVAAGDLDGDGRADFANRSNQDSVDDFRLVLESDSPVTRALCASGKHFPKAQLVKADGVVYDLTDLVVGSCDSSGGMTEVKIASGKTKEFKGHVTLLK